MIYACKEKDCNFKAFNEPALRMHIEEKHKKQQEKSQDEPVTETQPQRNFLARMLKKPVQCKTLNNEIITGILAEFNNYEILLHQSGKKIVLFKHAMVSIQEQKDEVQNAI